VNTRIFWTALEACGGAVLSLVSSFAVARIIGPTELGIGAAAVGLNVLLWVAVNALFADPLVQRMTVDDAVLSSAFWASTVSGTVAMVVQCAGGWGLAALLHDPRLVAMTIVLAAPLPLVGAAGVMQGIVTRAFAYRALALRTVAGQGLGTLTGVGCALWGAGAWAPVVQQAVATAAGAAILLALSGWRPSLRWHWQAVRQLLSFGLPLTASTLVLIGRYRVFAIVIGGTAGAATLGQVHIAFRLVDTVRELSFTALWRLMLPVLARHQQDRGAMLHCVDRMLRRSCCIMLPLCAGMALSLGPVVSLMLGPHWAEAGQAALPLVGLMVLLSVMFPAGVAMVAAGQVQPALYANIASLLISAGGVLLLQPSDPWQAVMVWCATQAVVSPYALWASGRALGVGPLRPLTGGMRPGWPLPRRTAVEPG